jgi:hypothetical protein
MKDHGLKNGICLLSRPQPMASKLLQRSYSQQLPSVLQRCWCTHVRSSSNHNRTFGQQYMERLATKAERSATFGEEPKL